VQVVWQRIPHRRTNHRESPSGGGVSRQRGTTRSRRLADRSCCRDATLEVVWQWLFTVYSLKLILFVI